MTNRDAEALNILNRPFHGGSRVTNCVVHMNKEWHDRPKSCENCMTDMANTINYAIRVNEFLNKNVDDAKAVLSGIRQPLFEPEPDEAFE